MTGEQTRRGLMRLIYITRVPDGEYPVVRDGFGLGPSLTKVLWSKDGNRVQDIVDASFVVLCPELGCDVVQELQKLDAGLIAHTAVLVHPQGGPDYLDVVLKWPGLVRDRLIPCSTSGGKLGGGVKRLAQAVARGDNESFQKVLGGLLDAVAVAMTEDQPIRRMWKADDELPDEFKLELRAIGFVRHRLSGTVGAVLTSFQDWVEDPSAEGIKRFFGQGRAVWNEIKALLLGGEPCEWQKRTCAEAVIERVELGRKNEVEEKLSELVNAAKNLEEVLIALDAPEPHKARDLLTREDAIGSFRSWLRELDRYLAKEELLACGPARQ
jgi:hypothetical protein